jgi:hypothetical protein
MSRPDLLALTPDDLAAMANRGLVKRAQKELEANTFTAQWNEEQDGTIQAKWSDGVTCILPGGKTLKEARCDCAATELCRHILRTVLAWQQQQQTSAASVTPIEPWDPGRITDEMIEGQTSKAVRDRAALLWSQGVLAELLRSAKPSARFHCPGHTIRFPVPDDLRYAHCSCSDPAPCVHAILAVRAFRLLSPDDSSGIVSDGPLDAPAPRETLTAAEHCLHDLVQDGFVTVGTAWRDRARRVSAECAGVQLMWPAQILEELAEDFDRYSAHDAAFGPGQSVERLGELLLRLDAIAAGCAPVPQAFIRGLKSDRDSDLGSARFIGLGASVAQRRHATHLTVFLQDCDNGHAMTLVREFAENPESTDERKAYHQLARAPAVKDASIAVLAGGQLITQGGKRTASGRLVIGRARAVVNPQNFAWEQLKAPVLVENFSELSARLQMLPPASFRPRRAGADFHVCPLGAVERSWFDGSSNSIIAIVHDTSGDPAMLVHPWSERGQGGAEALLAALQKKPLFVAGHVGLSGQILRIQPTALVFADDNGARSAAMPWIDHAPKSSVSHPTFHGSGDRRFRYRAAAEVASELILNGLRRTRSQQWAGWHRAVLETEECGLHRLAELLRQVQESHVEMTSILRLFKMLKLASDIG